MELFKTKSASEVYQIGKQKLQDMQNVQLQIKNFVGESYTEINQWIDKMQALYQQVEIIENQISNINFDIIEEEIEIPQEDISVYKENVFLQVQSLVDEGKLLEAMDLLLQQKNQEEGDDTIFYLIDFIQENSCQRIFKFSTSSTQISDAISAFCLFILQNEIKQNTSQQKQFQFKEIIDKYFDLKNQGFKTQIQKQTDVLQILENFQASYDSFQNAFIKKFSHYQQVLQKYNVQVQLDQQIIAEYEKSFLRQNEELIKERIKQQLEVIKNAKLLSELFHAVEHKISPQWIQKFFKTL